MYIYGNPKSILKEEGPSPSSSFEFGRFLFRLNVLPKLLDRIRETEGRRRPPVEEELLVEVFLAGGPLEFLATKE